MRVSALGFGCGATGGMIIAADRATKLRAVARAVDAGITYFDTAQAYGNGASESGLGEVLAALKPNVVVGSKVMLNLDEFSDIESAIVRAAEISLRRLQMERLDLFQLHNPIGITPAPGSNWIALSDLDAVSRAFERLRAQGKIAHWGINGLGETAALHQAVAICGAQTIQACFNLLNPSAGHGKPVEPTFQDYRGLIPAAARAGVGVIAIRVLAGGALTDADARHALASPSVDPIATHSSYDADVVLARHFRTWVDKGWANTLAEAALRFAMFEPGVSSALVGFSSLDQLEQAIAAAERGPLPGGLGWA